MSTVYTFSLISSILPFFCLFLSLSTAHFLGNETDRLALLVFKSHITSDPFRVMSSWNDSNHFCDWEGVACSLRHQRVRALDLNSRNLAGSVPPHVGNLSFLIELALHNNSFGGEIPPELGHLFRLENLFLYKNSFSSEFPVNISNCFNLIRMSASHNNLVGKIPMELGSLPKLTTLNLEMNMLTGEIPPSLGNITSLQELVLGGNQLQKSIPSTLGQLKVLNLLVLALNRLSGTIPSSLYNLSNLESLRMGSNDGLSGTLPSEIGHNLPNLKVFLIGGNNFSGQIPTSLLNVSGLQRFQIAENQFTGKVPITVGNLKDLQFLSLDKNHLGSGRLGDLDFIASLTNCSRLQHLDISVNHFAGMIPASIGNFSYNCSRLYLGENKLFGNIPSEIGNLQNLIILTMENNFFTGSIPMGFRKLQKLQILRIGQNQLSGHLPNFLCNMSQLFHLHLPFNRLKGSISSAICNHNLQYLYLSSNNFTGGIPEQIGLSSSLIELVLSYNSLNGPIPSEVGNLKHLTMFDVSKNKISGEIPSELGSCLSIQALDLSGNSFQGSFPSSLYSLKDLQYLDLSQNNISGKIPKELEKSSILTYLNLSFNDFEGEVPVEGIFRNASAFSAFGNRRICGGIPEYRFPKCNIQTSRKKRTNLTLKVTLGVLIPSLILVILGLIFVVCFKKKTTNIVFEKSHEYFKSVSYHDLHKATDGFSSANLIGMGSSGSVYKGLLAEEEGHIAVKVFNLMERSCSKTFTTECEVLRQVRHRNLLKILTVCSSIDFNGNDFKALVFYFMPNGSLESWLHPSLDGQYLQRPFNVYERLDLSIDIASALDYLHNNCGRPIVHCDLKASNVLLGDDLTAHVSDFGLAKFLTKNNSSNTSEKNESSTITARGTIGYIPPEYGMGANVSTEGDIYGYGILLLEIFTGKRPTDHMFKDGLTLHEFSKRALPRQVMDIVDFRMLPKETRGKEGSSSIHQIKECLSSIIKIGVMCSLDLASDRMNIKDVLKELYAIKEACV